MDRPLPVPPKRYDLVESFNALALAGKKPTEKKLQDPPGPIGQPVHQGILVGRPSPEMLAVVDALDSRRRPPLAPPLGQMLESTPTPTRPAGKQSLITRYALKYLKPRTATKPALSPPLTPPPPNPCPDPIVSPKAVSKPPPSKPSLNVTPNRPRSCSVPASFVTSRNTAQCCGMVKSGRQCFRQVKLPATHCHLDPTPVLYCHQHKEIMTTAQTGFYVRNVGNADRFVEFSGYIPKYLQTDTQLALRVEMEKAMAPADVPGYIYTFEIRDPKRSDVILLKVGRAVNLNKRLDQWDKQCGSKVQIPRGWWPGTVEDEDGAGGSLLKGNIKAGDPGPFCHRVERLVHIELADLSLNTPYLNPRWPNNTCDPATGTPKKSSGRETTCLDCGVIHREIFTFRRLENGQYTGKEWELIVKPVIEKWGRFVKEYYT